MPYAQRDGSGDIVGLFAQPQPGLAEEFVPEGTTLTEKILPRIAREFKTLVSSLPSDDKDAVKLELDRILEYIYEGQRVRARRIVDNIGVLPVLSVASRDLLRAKIQEIP